MAWNHLTNINKNNSKNNHNNFCLTSCARIYPKPSTIDMKWTLIKDLGKTCCNLQSKNKGVIKMSSFRGVASVLQGGAPKKKCVKERVLTRLTWQPPCCVLLKRRFKKKRGGSTSTPGPSLAMSLSCDSRLPSPLRISYCDYILPTKFTRKSLTHESNLPHPSYAFDAPTSSPPPSLQRGVNTSLSLLQRRNPMGSLWIMNKLEEK